MAHVIQPQYRGPMEPVFPCREMPTRHCPASLNAVCPPGPCARYDSTDPTPWLPEPVEAAVVEPVVEYAQRYTGGAMMVRPDGIEDYYPLHLWIEGEQRRGGKIYRRTVIVVEDWTEVPTTAPPAPANSP